MTNQKKEMIEQVKLILEENDGEMTYWGEKISPHPGNSLAEVQNELVQNFKELDPGSTRETVVRDDVVANDLTHLKDVVIGDCHLCPLGDTRIKLVFGVGNPQTDVMFVGEGPGFEEDRKGEPFVGKAGQLLDKIIGAINLDRTKVYIANVVKCHPMKDSTQPENRGNDRPPTIEEMEKCLPFLFRQIEIIQPKIIVTLGSVATKALLDRSGGITALRGKIYDVQLGENKFRTKILPTFHPAALLRDDTLKRPVWDDMKLLRDFLQE
ncbi:MAG: uracil-DNA glycosylase family protein [Elusimicrobiota bacterium]